MATRFYRLLVTNVNINLKTLLLLFVFAVSSATQISLFFCPFVLERTQFVILCRILSYSLIIHMSFWKKNPSSSKPNAPTIRIEKIAINKTSSSTAPKVSSRSQSQGRPGTKHIKLKSSLPETGTISTKEINPTRLRAKKQSNSRKRSPAYQRVESDTSDDDDDDEGTPSLNKRRRLVSNEIEDPNRSLSSKKQFSQIDSTLLIHAADIASYKLGFSPAFGQTASDNVLVYLQYPGSSMRER